jgi:hypothetical protein
MAAETFNTREALIAEITARSGKSAADAAAAYEEIVATKTQAERAEYYSFCLDNAQNDTAAADISFVNMILDSHYPPNAGSSKISADAGVNDVQGIRNVGSGSRTAKSEYARPEIGAAAEEAIKSLLSGTSLEQRKATTAASSIKSLLIQKPNPSTYLMVGGKPMQVVPDIASDKLATLESQLVQTEENLKAFGVVKAAVDNKTPMPVHINDEGNKRVVGCIVAVGKDSKIFSIAELKAFLFTDTLGCIPGKPGVLLNKWEDRKVASSGGVARKPTTTVSIKWVSRDTAIKEGNVVFISKPCTEKEAKDRGFESATDKNVRLRIDQSFKVSVYSRRSDKNIERTKRLTGKAEVPKFILLPEYKDHFADTKRKDAVELPSTADELQAALDTLDTGMAAIVHGDFKPSAAMLSGSPGLNQLVNTMREAANA